MPDMFEQVEEWWVKSTDQLVCCHSRSELPNRNSSELHHSDVFAALIKKGPDATTPTRCSSVPDHSDHLQSINLRQKLHKLDAELAGVHDRFAHVFAVTSSRPCWCGRISHTLDATRDISTSVLYTRTTMCASSTSNDTTHPALVGAGAQTGEARRQAGPAPLSSVSPSSISVYLDSPIWRDRLLTRCKLDTFTPHPQPVNLRTVSEPD